MLPQFRSQLLHESAYTLTYYVKCSYSPYTEVLVVLPFPAWTTVCSSVVVDLVGQPHLGHDSEKEIQMIHKNSDFKKVCLKYILHNLNSTTARKKPTMSTEKIPN